MGNRDSSNLSKEDLDQLTQVTHFDRKEIKTIFKQFKKENPSGFISKGELKNAIGLMGLQPDDYLITRIFQVYDKNGDGKIDFRECVNVLSIASRGNPREKLEFSFHLYDLDGNGFISREEFSLIVKSLFKSLPSIENLPPDRNTPEKVTDKFFETADVNHDKQVSFEEFATCLENEPFFSQSLGLFAN